MSHPATCPCTPIGKQALDIETSTLRVSVTYDPGCSVCAACTCTPIYMDLREADRWRVYTAENRPCHFCYPDPQDLLFSQPQEEHQQGDPCVVCGAAGDVCGCFIDGAAGIAVKQGRRRGLRRLGQRLMSKLGALRSDVKIGDLRRAISRRLTTGRRGRSAGA